MASGHRNRLHVLIGDGRVAGTLILAFIWPLVCVRGTWFVLHRVAFTTVAWHLMAGAAILSLVSYLTLVPAAVDRLRAPTAWCDAAGILVGSLAAFLILAAAGGAPTQILLAPFALATFAAALAEEVVFRRHLPDRLATILRVAGARPGLGPSTIVVIPQLSFAIAHAANSAFAAAGIRTFVVLFVGGVLYQGVTRISGLWAAAAVHSALNLLIAIANGPA